MLTFKKILCPTDFSEVSYHGLAKAVSLASGTSTEICVLHVAEPTAPLVETAIMTRDAVGRRVEAVTSLCEVLKERVPAHVRSRPLMKEGSAAAEIVRTARQEDVDLIVLTTHGGQGWQPGKLGNVASEVLENAHCPVLTIGCSTGDERSLDCATPYSALHNHYLKSIR